LVKDSDSHFFGARPRKLFIATVLSVKTTHLAIRLAEFRKHNVTKILLVEDNEMNRDMLSRRLERKDFEVVIATDGQAGVNMATSESPDLILMDLSLPVMDGWEATRMIKANGATAGIPIIALTAHAMSSDEQKAREAGCNDYDTKPVNFKRLLEKIEALLP
jgi:two-component system cell cycle response regulator DivK